MPIKAFLDTLEDLDESIASLYTETEDGKFALEIEGDIKGHPSTAALETAFRKEQDKRKEQGKKLQEAEAKLEALSWLPDDLTEDGLEALKVAAEEAGAGDDKDVAERIEEARKRAEDRLEAKHSREVEALKGAVEAATAEATKYKESFHKTLRENALSAAIAKANVAPHFVEAVKGLHASNLRIIEDDGEVEVVMGADDERPIDFMVEWAQSDEGKVFIAAPPSGGGSANGSGGSHAGPNPFKKETFNRTEQARIAQSDPEKAKRLAKEAGVKKDHPVFRL